ncbi:MAG: DUF5606 domain-containing protein [Bacteroidales bacterium]|jgi:hypothetical protein|nr:DUF5606 domain-containing protein [Bacteroidales bacterium]MBR4218272.1 DUF5606 domain-containing protein [Bacteroidales bacterium]
MDLSKILSITGKSGLYKLISQNKTSFIVESLNDGKRIPAFSHDGVSTLDNISIFTEDNDIPLVKVLQAIYTKENGAALPEKMDNEQMKKYFAEILPDYDRERVYVSNMKKVFSWYNILIEHKLIDVENASEEKKEDKE